MLQSLTLFVFLALAKAKVRPEAKANAAKAKQAAKPLAMSNAATPKDAAPCDTNTESPQSGHNGAALPGESPQNEHPAKAETPKRNRRLMRRNSDAVVDGAIGTRFDSHTHLGELRKKTGESIRELVWAEIYASRDEGVPCPRHFGLGFTPSSTSALGQRTSWRNQATTAAGHCTKSSHARLQSHTAETELATPSDLWNAASRMANNCRRELSTDCSRVSWKLPTCVAAWQRVYKSRR